MLRLSIAEHLSTRLRDQAVHYALSRHSSTYLGVIQPPRHNQLRYMKTLTSHQGNLRVQHVLIRARRFTWKKIATIFLRASLSFALLSLTLGMLAIEADEAEDIGLVKEKLEEVAREEKIGTDVDDKLELESKGQIVDTHEYDEGENTDVDTEIPEDTPEGAWFIPLGLAKKLPSTYYSNDDPEWQAFVRFAKDKDTQNRVKNELCSMILKSFESNKNIERALGKGIRCKSYWIDIDYPSGPPPEYERYGIEWASTYVALLYRPVNLTTVKRVEKALWPTAVTISAYATLKEIIQLQYVRLRKSLGLHGDMSSEPTMPPDPSRAQQSKENDPDKGERITFTTVQSNKESNVDLLSFLPEYPRDDQHIKPGLALFRRKLSKKWMPTPSTPPAGSVLLQGLIEYRGSTATCTVDVAAAYVVTESKWHLVFVNIKRVQPNVQWPRGGLRG